MSPNKNMEISELLKEIENLKKQLELKNENESFFEEDFTGNVIHDSKGFILNCNNRFSEIFGYSNKEELIGRNIEIFIPNKEEFEKGLAELKNKKGYINYEVVRKHKSGKLINVIVNNVAVFDKNGEVTLIKSSLFDISERREAEKIIIESEKKFRNFFDDDLTGDFILDSKGTILDCNPAFLEIFEYENKSQLLGESITKLYINTKEFEYIKNRLKNENGKLKNYETIRKCKSGRLINIIENKTASFDLFGEISEIKGYVYDITERKNFEKYLLTNQKKLSEQNEEYQALNEELKQTNSELLLLKEMALDSEIKFRKLFENMDQGFALHQMIYDDNDQPIDYKFILANKSFEKLTGLEITSIIGKTAKEVLPNVEDVWIKNYGTVAQTGIPMHFENYSQDLNKYYNIVVYSPQKDFFATIFNDVTQNKYYEKSLIKAKDEIEKSENKFRSLIKNLPVGVLLQGANAETLLYNDEALNLLGLTKDQLIGRTSYDSQWNVIHEDGSPFPGETHPVPIAIATGKAVRNVVMGVYNPLKKNRNWLLVTAIPQNIYDTADKQVICTFINITDRKIAEKALQESEEKYKSIVDSALFGIAITKGYNIIYSNPALEKITYYSKQEIESKPYLDFFHPDDYPKIIRRNINRLKGLDVDEYLQLRIICKNGDVKYVDTATTECFINNQKVKQSVIIDVTEKVKALDALRENEEKIDLLMNSTAEGIYGIDKNGICTYANNACLNLLGFKSKDEMIGKNMHMLIHYKTIENKPLPPEQCKIHSAFTDGIGTHETNEVFWRTDGTSFSVEYFSFPQIKNGTVVGAVITFQDITERKFKEKRIKEFTEELKELNATKDKFFSILSHDLRSPFNSIIGITKLLLDNIYTFDLPKIENLLQIMNSTLNQTYSLLEEILIWSKSQSGKLSFEPQKIEFTETCNEIIASFKLAAESKNVSINCFESDKIELFADLNMFKIIMRNLISNAIKFSYKDSVINVYAVPQNDFALIVIADKGVGIEKENQHKLWKLSEQYTTIGTANEKGTGLGLSLCKEFVEKHGCKIWVESELGKGSDFKFNLPLFK